MSADYFTVECIAARLCQLAGGTWSRKRTKRNQWREKAFALIEQARKRA